MTRARLSISVAVVAALAIAGIALAGGAPPPDPQPDPAPGTVVATGAAQARVSAPKRRTDAAIDRAARAARERAIPRAIAAARAEAAALAASADLRLGRLVAVRRDVQPYFGADDGRFGPGRWCGRTYAGRRVVRRADGTTRRVARFRYACQVPRDATIRITATFAAEPAG